MTTPTARFSLRDPDARFAMYTVVLALALVVASFYWLVNAPTFLDFESDTLLDRSGSEILKQLGGAIGIDLLALICLGLSLKSFYRSIRRPTMNAPKERRDS